MKKQPNYANKLFEDLGFKTEEATNLVLRSQLMSAIQDYITNHKLTQETVAQRLGVSRPRVSEIMNGKIHLFTIDKLIVLAEKLGQHVELVIRDEAA